jgi:TPR repeat protein
MVWILSVISPPVVTAQSGTAQTTQARQPTQQKKVTPEEEFKALLQKAEQGDAQAQFNLGVVYAYGLVGVPQDSAQALAWYRKAAEQGSG